MQNNDYEYRNKPGKQLARVLSDHPVKHDPSAMFRVKGELTTRSEEKIRYIFELLSELI